MTDPAVTQSGSPERERLATDAIEFATRAASFARNGPDDATVPFALTSIAASLAAGLSLAPQPADSAALLREAHRLLMPPHPGDVYQSSALCSCGEWQWDAERPSAMPYRSILHDHAAHVRLALEADPTAGADRAWLIHFEDAEIADEIFMGQNAEAGARRRYMEASVSWNCTLFISADPGREGLGASPAGADSERPLDVDYERMRMDRGWPTPNHMRRTADALDSLTPARYGDVLRWFADLCDASLPLHAALSSSPNNRPRAMNDTEALWTDPAPRTPEGQRLWANARNGFRDVLTDAGWHRDIGQRICQIENEGAALEAEAPVTPAGELLTPEALAAIGKVSFDPTTNQTMIKSRLAHGGADYEAFLMRLSPFVMVEDSVREAYAGSRLAESSTAPVTPAGDRPLDVFAELRDPGLRG